MQRNRAGTLQFARKLNAENTERRHEAPFGRSTRSRRIAISASSGVQRRGLTLAVPDVPTEPLPMDEPLVA